MSGGRSVAVPQDVTDATAITGAVDLTETTLGSVSVLVNSAGVPDAQFATKMQLDLIDSVIDTNLRGPFLLSNRSRWPVG